MTYDELASKYSTQTQVKIKFHITINSRGEAYAKCHNITSTLKHQETIFVILLQCLAKNETHIIIAYMQTIGTIKTTNTIQQNEISFTYMLSQHEENCFDYSILILILCKRDVCININILECVYLGSKKRVYIFLNTVSIDLP